MQLRLDAADRLVELVEERRGPVLADEAARRLFAFGTRRSGSRGACSTTSSAKTRGSLVRRRGRARRPPGADFRWSTRRTSSSTSRRPGCARALRASARSAPSACASSSSPTSSRRSSIRACRSARLISALTGLRDAQLRGAPRPRHRRAAFLAFAGDAVLVAHNARFDLAFLDRETERLTGARLAAPVVDTVGLARRLLAGRTSRAGLASLAQFFGTAATPCHRALPDAQATAEILLMLIGLAQERGAADRRRLCRARGATRPQGLLEARRSRSARRRRPASTCSATVTTSVLYVGRARDLRARLRSYFRSPTGSAPRSRRRSPRSSGSSGA